MQLTTGTDAIQTKSHFTYAVRPDRSRRPLKLVCGRTQTFGITPFYGLRDLFDPLIKMLHSSLKDLIGAFVGDKKKFDKPVKVGLVPGSDIGVIGFITRENMDEWGLPGQVAVYLPQSYNFAGNLIVIPRERVTAIDVPSGDVMAFVVSGGITGQKDEEA